MRFTLQIFIGVALSVLLISASYSQPAASIAEADNQFAFDLYSQLSSGKGNVFFSPYSLSSALEMTYEGARNQTADEIRMALHLPSDEIDWRTDVSGFIQRMNAPNKFYELRTANALWAQKAYPFKEDYLNLIKNIYFAEARNLDFVAAPEASRTTINNWVADKTENHINDLLPQGSITTDTRLVLTDAVYFKGQWETPFRKENTQLNAFWFNSKDPFVKVDTMQLAGQSFNYFDNDKIQVLQLPYQGKDLSMVILLPRSYDIQGLEKTLSLAVLKQWQEGMTSQEVNVFLPKFELNATYQMGYVLKAMGIKLAFDQNNADFSGMANKIPGGNLYIGDVFHKAWINTNEEGTEAAAATGVRVGVQEAIYNSSEPKEFRADHPFIFVIQDNNTGHILFMGRMSDPR